MVTAAQPDTIVDRRDGQMFADGIWIAGEVCSLLVLAYGAYLVAMERLASSASGRCQANAIRLGAIRAISR
jgi:hypothetical protein